MILALVTPLDPLHGDGYQFFSGIGLTVGAPFLWYWHHRCVEKGCWRKGHPDPKHGHPVCRKHQQKLP